MAASIKAEELFGIGNFAVTNSVLSAGIIVLFLILFILFYTKRMGISPISKFQLFLEWVIESIYNLTKDVVGEKTAKSIFPLIFTFFTFIIISNWFGLLPITGSIGFAEATHGEKSSASLPLLVIPLGNEEAHEEKVDVMKKEEAVEADSHEEEKAANEERRATVTSEAALIPFLRAPSADLNFTIALALISFVLIQVSALRGAGIHYLGKYFDYRVAIGKGWAILLTPVMFIINFLWKTLELLLEFSKILSFSFRLFGNIFAGEVLLAVITSLTFGLLTLPFVGFEIFVGFIQAIVFIFLTMVFIKVSVEAH